MKYEAYRNRCRTHELFFVAGGDMICPIRTFEGQQLHLQPLSQGIIEITPTGATYSVPAGVLHACGWEDEAIAALTIAEVRRAIMKELDISFVWAYLFETVPHVASSRSHLNPESIIYVPETILGRQAHRILWFWRQFDAMTAADWVAVNRRFEDDDSRRPRAPIDWDRHDTGVSLYVMDQTGRAVEALLTELVDETPDGRALEVTLRERQASSASSCSVLASRTGVAAAELLDGLGVGRDHLAIRYFGHVVSPYDAFRISNVDPYADDPHWYSTGAYYGRYYSAQNAS